MRSGQTLLGVPDTFLRTVLSLSPTVNTCVDTISMVRVWLSVVTASDLHMDSARLRADDIGGPVDAVPAAVEQPTLMRQLKTVEAGRATDHTWSRIELVVPYWGALRRGNGHN